MFVTLLTDFGTLDGFIGAMKGVILSLAPDACIIDLTHDVPPWDVWSGAWALREAAATFPVKTIHIAVVDPGVGTQRRPIVLQHQERLFLGPDNGLLTLAAPTAAGWHLDRPQFHRQEVSRTFHGRDIFAAVAGHLAAGISPGECGSPIDDWAVLDLPAPVIGDGDVTGVVLRSDRFGNLITNITASVGLADRAWRIDLDGRSIPLRSTFGDVGDGEWVAYLGSSGYLELAIREGNAAAALGDAARKRRVTLCKA